MNPELYERLYSMRFQLVILLVLLIAACGYVIFGTSMLNPLGGKATEVAVIPSAEIIPTNTAIPATETPTDVPTSEAEIENNPTETPLPTQENTQTAPATEVVTSSDGTYYVCTGYLDGWLSFRMGPSRSRQLIRYLPEGQHVTFIKQADTFYPWYSIEVDGVQGYAYGGYLCELK